MSEYGEQTMMLCSVCLRPGIYWQFIGGERAWTYCPHCDRATTPKQAPEVRVTADGYLVLRPEVVGELVRREG